MTEEITIRQAAEETTGAVPSGQAPTAGITGGARSCAERTDKKPLISWTALLDEAVKKPGYIHEAYCRFHNYSLGNQLLALFQCLERGIQPGPLGTFPKWKELGRYVKKSEKALILCLPLTCKRTRKVRADDGGEQEEEFLYTHFTYKAHWFVLSQTEGQEYKAPSIPEWNEQKALAALKIERVPYEDMDGNIQGYARRDGKIAVSPIAALPHKTLFHELAHYLLHCGDIDLPTPTRRRAVRPKWKPRPWRFCAVNRSACPALNSAGVTYRLGRRARPSANALPQRIFHAADRILKAGYSQAARSQEES